MKESIESQVRREIVEDEERYRRRRKERLESGEDILCSDCDSNGIIGLNFLYNTIQLGYGINRDGTRSGRIKEIECPRCKGLGQFNVEKDKLTQEIKRLIAEDKT